MCLMLYFGSDQAARGPLIQLYINHPIPDKDMYVSETPIGLSSEDRHRIEQLGGNNYRKVFNIYSKLSFYLEQYLNYSRVTDITTWQEYRDSFFLDLESPCRIAFLSDYEFSYLQEKSQLPDSLCETIKQCLNSDNVLHLFSGKKCISAFNFEDRCFWMSEYFAQVKDANAIVTPYFDYRQLSNERIIQLQKLIIERIS